MSTAAKVAAMTRHVTLAHCDDWVAMYVNGRKVRENHSLSEHEILEALGISFDQRWLDDEWVEEHGMPESVGDLP